MEVVRLATPKASGRGRPQKSASAAVCAPDVKFPVEVPKAPQTAPQAVSVLVKAISEDAIKLKLLPGANAVRDMLDKTFGNGGWRMRRYSADGRLWCQVGVYIPSTREYCDKESGALNLPCRDVAQMKEDTSFVSAASFWGVGRDVMELDDIVLKSTQVPIVKDDKGVCRLQTSLKVDRFAYDDAGSITMVQFITGEGKKILWPEA
jgi:hypothetical protein